MAITSHLAPTPPGFKVRWRDILEKNVALYRRLPEDITLVVEALIPWFIDKVQWEWSHWDRDLDDSEKELQKVCVACEACLLIARRSKDDYKGFKKFIFFPRDLTPVRGKDSKAAGDASPSEGRVRQGWYWTKIGMEDGNDNYNLTLHEFAHVLDFREKKSDSVPYFDKRSVRREYEAFMENEYKDICRAWENKTGCEVMEEYATKKVEFFTVATEAFFEYPAMMRLKRRALYSWMEKIYGMDTAQWSERASYSDLQMVRAGLLPQWDWETTWDSTVTVRWPAGVSADQYDAWRIKAQEIQREEIKSLEEKIRREKVRREKLRLERLQRKARERLKKEQEERERKELLRLERLKRKERERDLMNNRTVVLKHPNGIPRLKYRLVNGHREGLFERWNEEGQLVEETDFSQGYKHGKVNYYYANGKIELEGFHSFNERVGIWQGWHEDGTLSFRSEYAEGELKTWKRFNGGGNTQTFGKVKNRFAGESLGVGKRADNTYD